MQTLPQSQQRGYSGGRHYQGSHIQDIFLIAGGHVRGTIWLDLMPMATRQLIVGAPELIVFYGDIVREHLVFHKAAFTLAYELYHVQRGAVEHVGIVDSAEVTTLHEATAPDPNELLLPPLQFNTERGEEK